MQGGWWNGEKVMAEQREEGRKKGSNGFQVLYKRGGGGKISSMSWTHYRFSGGSSTSSKSSLCRRVKFTSILIGSESSPVSASSHRFAQLLCSAKREDVWGWGGLGLVVICGPWVTVEAEEVLVPPSSEALFKFEGDDPLACMISAVVMTFSWWCRWWRWWWWWLLVTSLRWWCLELDEECRLWCSDSLPGLALLSWSSSLSV